MGKMVLNGKEYIGGGSGGGASELNDLEDVSLTSLLNNQILKYNSASGQFENKDLKTDVGDVYNPSEKNSGGRLASFKVSSYQESQYTATLVGNFGSHNEIVGFIFIRGACYNILYRSDANANIYSNTCSRMFGSDAISATYNNSTKKIILTIPAWSDCFFFGYVNGMKLGD